MNLFRLLKGLLQGVVCMFSFFLFFYLFLLHIIRHVYPISADDHFHEFVNVLVWSSYDCFAAFQNSKERDEKVRQITEKGIKVIFLNTYGGVGNGSGAKLSLESDVEKGLGPQQKMSRIALQNNVIAPPAVLPPPKWKLSILIAFCVYVNVAATIISGQGDVMAAAKIPVGASTMFVLMQVVFVLTYAMLPLVMSIPIVTQWLRAPRTPLDKMLPIQRVLGKIQLELY